MNKINIMEVGPRDGFQNIKSYIPLKNKIEIIDGLIDCGVEAIQITSFVSEKAIPQMKDSELITKYCISNFPNKHLFALVPNLYGAKKAWSLGLKHVSYVVSLSETHNIKNINRTHRESLEELLEIKSELPELDITIDISTTFGCPYEGKFSSEKLIKFIKQYYDIGIRSFNLCDTIGIANPKEIREFIREIKLNYFDVELEIHIHDTRNMGMVNSLAAIEEGVIDVQTTLGGLGGCPFAPGASGNLATEDLIYMLNEMGYETGINFKKLLLLAKKQKELIKEGIYSGHHINI